MFQKENRSRRSFVKGAIASAAIVGFDLNGIQLSVTSSILIPCGESFRMRFQEDL